SSPATATPAPAANNDAMLWGIGGGALLLIGIAGAALARRRRRDDVDAVYDEPAVAAEPMPSFAAAAPAVAVARPARTTPVAYSHGDADLDAMVAAPPSAENPFLTRAKRLRRARQLIAQREAAATPMAAPQTTHAEPVASAPVDRSQTVYRFGGQGASSPGFLKPRTR
nr:hypothetical protein [Sphingobium sp.]